MISDIKTWIINPGRDIYAKLNKLGAFYLHPWTHCPFSVSAAECVSCILSAVWIYSRTRRWCPLRPRGCAVSPPPSTLCPAFIHHSDHRACNSDMGLLLTPAISSTVLRNAPFFLSLSLSLPDRAYRRIDSHLAKCFPVHQEDVFSYLGSAAVMNGCLAQESVAWRLIDNYPPPPHTLCQWASADLYNMISSGTFGNKIIISVLWIVPFPPRGCRTSRINTKIAEAMFCDTQMF